MISAAVEKLRNDGVLSLVDAGTRYILELARIEYYRIQGYRAIEINEIQAEFVTHGARSAAIELFNNMESEMVADMTDEMEEDDVFWDVGANVGFHSCFAGLSKGSITLVEFEPLRPAITTLKQNTRRNGLSPTIHEVALSDTDGEMDLDPESLSNQFSSEGVTVETVW
ncbi:FkbM family methyltransferase [Haloarcula sp. S1AR25-5A]|uniref:FkbM family methyltransferase n=1 Tax=Haloarcula terrestris TaxID=2950533 RepID=A0AAE4F125_9EURY|nr:FkbM family methyltransferase [Haloarcula terrestris]MDS0223826.1 FkbM family methyltransferase [Haloarcula terrestris]